MEGLELHRLAEGPGDEINVFIHGYCALNSAAAYDNLVSLILRARPRGTSYLLAWEGGTWTELGSTFAGLTVVAGTSAVVAGTAMSSGGLAAAAAAVTARDFRRRERVAEEVGAGLRRRLSSIPGVKHRRMNFIGHSLGARVVHYALAECDWSSYLLGDAILLGSAADAHDGDWAYCASQLEGNIYNVYLRSDGILRMAPTIRPYSGVMRIPGRPRGVRNHRWRGVAQGRLATAAWGHLSYWYNLASVLEDSWPSFRQAPQHYFQYEVECPEYGGDVVVLPDDGEYECAYCGEDVSVVGCAVQHE